MLLANSAMHPAVRLRMILAVAFSQVGQQWLFPIVAVEELANVIISVFILAGYILGHFSFDLGQISASTVFFSCSTPIENASGIYPLNVNMAMWYIACIP